VRRAAAAPARRVAPRLWPGFPRQDLKLAREIVGASHAQEAKVRELIEARPALVHAWWDWGFGDWESPLGAASHVGQRAIAEFLIQRGARVDIFAAAMLGLTDVVRAFVAARPGVQRALGPHGIPLRAHAQAGGERAAETLAYLDSLGDAGKGIATVPLAEDRKPLFVGDYAIDGAPPEETPFRVLIDKKGQLKIEKVDETSQLMFHVAPDEFCPAGVPSVRIRFEVTGDGPARSLTLIERDPVLVAKRIGG
jgi:hypothetical protein